MKLLKYGFSLLLSCCFVLATAPAGFAQQADQTTLQTPVQPAPQSPAQLQQSVAPIALYPDSLVAQILAASTYPTQVVEADRWMQEHSDLQGKKLADEVNKQPWDPSVKALTGFPSVLSNMDKNLAWTSSLGDAYVNQPNDVMAAVQVMRQRAQQAGNLQSTSQETVTNQGPSIVIAPANPQVVYVPEYDPWLVYGAPIAVWPGWYPYPGLYVGGPGIFFGTGFGLGFYDGFGWGWNHWGSDWNHHAITFDHDRYLSHSRTFIHHDDFNHGFGGLNRAGRIPGGGGFPRNPGAHGFAAPQHGFAPPAAQLGSHSGAFSGFDHGGIAHGFSARGQASMGGGFHGGGGGFHGGGGHGGGGHR